MHPPKRSLTRSLPGKKKVALREKFVCPLCERIPEKIQLLVDNEQGDPTDMYNFVVDHVADHLKSLSLIAVRPVPALDTTTSET